MISKIKYSIISPITKLINILIKILGIILTIAITLSFTSIPYRAYHQLSLPSNCIKSYPDFIITYSGEGVPAPETLMRIWTTAKMANHYPQSKVIIAYPAKNNDDTACLDLITSDLKSKGIHSSRIYFTTNGNNTFYQSTCIVEEHQLLPTDKLLIVSSPEHLYRTWRCYRKLGFNMVATKAAFPKLLAPRLLSKKKCNKQTDLNLRYNCWNYLKYEITVLREYVAIAYYKLRGWI